MHFSTSPHTFFFCLEFLNKLAKIHQTSQFWHIFKGSYTCVIVIKRNIIITYQSNIINSYSFVGSSLLFFPPSFQTRKFLSYPFVVISRITLNSFNPLNSFNSQTIFDIGLVFATTKHDNVFREANCPIPRGINSKLSYRL